jgi:rhodanese-related sulfurtransferase
MKLMLSHLGSMIAAVALAASTTGIANTEILPIPITADEAFDAVTMQIDPETGLDTSVILVDVRDPIEYFSSGAAAEVTEIHLLKRGRDVVPDWGKVRLLHEGKFVEYRTGGRYQRTRVARIDSLDTAPLAYNFPFWRRTETGWDKSTVDAFYDQLDGLDDDYAVLILYCRTGGRSSLAGTLAINGRVDPFLPPLAFGKVYEIDDPEGENGYGGFSGASYNDSYNGYAGFPARLTDEQTVPSVSWKDAGLPVTRAFKQTPQTAP